MKRRYKIFKHSKVRVIHAHSKKPVERHIKGIYCGEQELTDNQAILYRLKGWVLEEVE